jgi:hypothetical protein
MRYNNPEIPDDGKSARSQQNPVTQHVEYDVDDPNDSLEPPVLGA